MQKLLYVITVLALVFAAMVAEYRVIMVNIHPYVSEDVVYLEVFGQVDAYDLEVVENE